MTSPEVQEYVAQLENHIKSQEQALHSQANNQNLMLQQEQEKSIIKEQLDPSDDLDRLEHLLRSEIVVKGEDGDDWKAPDDTTGEWTASLNADNQTVEYTNPNPWLIAGIWKFQIYVELPDWEGNGETYERKIYDLFE